MQGFPRQVPTEPSQLCTSEPPPTPKSTGEPASGPTSHCHTPSWRPAPRRWEVWASLISSLVVMVARYPDRVTSWPYNVVVMRLFRAKISASLQPQSSDAPLTYHVLYQWDTPLGSIQGP